MLPTERTPEGLFRIENLIGYSHVYIWRVEIIVIGGYEDTYKKVKTDRGLGLTRKQMQLIIDVLLNSSFFS